MLQFDFIAIHCPSLATGWKSHYSLKLPIIVSAILFSPILSKIILDKKSAFYTLADLS